MRDFFDEKDEIQFSEPIIPQDNVKLEIVDAESSTWKVKEHVTGHAGEEYPAMKLQLIVTDESVKTEREGSRVKTINDQFNLAKYPYVDKESGEVKMLARNRLYQLEAGLGFDPVFVDDAGTVLEPRITRAGNKVAPSKDAKRKLNPDFLGAYFSEDGKPKVTNWVGQTVYANVGIERSEEFGDKNTIKGYRKPPVS